MRPLAHLARHIGLALRLRLGREHMLQELRVQQLVLDQLQDGILIIDAHLRIQHANAKAQALMARRDVLRLRDGCIHCRDPASHAELSRMTRTAPGTPNGGWFTVPQEGRRPLLIDVIALRISGETGTKPAFALRIRDPDRQHVPTALQLQRLLGLTLGESKAVLAIMQTPSQEAAAQRLGRGVTTLRTQLHHAYGKLGVHDPAGLARLLAAYGFAQPPQMR